MTMGRRAEKGIRRPDVNVVPQPVPHAYSVRQRVLRLLGLGMRSRGAIVGVSQVREAAKRNKVLFAVVAADASQQQFGQARAAAQCSAH